MYHGELGVRPRHLDLIFHHPAHRLCSHSFSISYTPRAPTVNGTLAANLDIYTYLTLAAEAGILDNKYQAGLAVIAPHFIGSFQTIASSTGGVCGNKAIRYGAQVNLTVASDAYAYTGKSFDNPSNKYGILSGSKPLYSTCAAF